MLVSQIFGSQAADIQLIDLAEQTDEIFSWPSQKMAELNKRVADSDFAVFASPTYKATYTGLLKAFLDRYPANGLRGVTAISVMTGADFSHSMAPTVNLIPLLLELGATVPMRGLYFNTAQFDRLDALVAARAGEVRNTFGSLAAVVDAIRAVDLGGVRASDFESSVAGVP